MQRFGLPALGTALLARAALGGEAALALLQQPPPAETFRDLDQRYYRPLAALLGVSLWLFARPGKGKDSENIESS
ncbi:hypothetical protein ODZ83_00115 [Acaricomes phytoseiuli]|uniref:hypothetical protein n=1 Tax=Acaricomes phytoseiuli TaxID=291968 RepID=UPI00037287B3|nr:hypothetical protein [Acaricomes phytoseiuli]MCW1248621.1 hypothetical protein [Acaricomes phytoseiuli]